MPAFISGPLEIATIGGSGIVNFGDAGVVSPKLATKTFGGSGGFCTAGLIVTVNGFSATNVIDPSLVDQPVIANN